MTVPPATVVLVASTPYRGHQLYDQRLARALAEHCRVLYVEPSRPRRSTSGSDPSSADDVRLVTPRTLPWGRWAPLAPLTAVLRAAAVRRAVARTPGPHAFIITSAHPWTVRWMGRGRTSYLLKDDYAAGAGLIGVPRSTVERRRRSVLARVDRVAAVSVALASGAVAMGALGAVEVIPPGCEVPRLTPVARTDGGRPRAVFVGTIGDRIDMDVLEAVAAAGVEVVAVGRHQPGSVHRARLDRLAERGFLTMTGECEPGEVVRRIQACDIALLPYTDSPFNRASFPLKLLEYLAVGRPVLATPLPAVRWLGAPHVHVVAEAGQVAGALPAVLAAAADPATAMTCQEFARRHGWADRARRHLDLVSEP